MNDVKRTICAIYQKVVRSSVTYRLLKITLMCPIEIKQTIFSTKLKFRRRNEKVPFSLSSMVSDIIENMCRKKAIATDTIL